MRHQSKKLYTSEKISQKRISVLLYVDSKETNIASEPCISFSLSRRYTYSIGLYAHPLQRSFVFVFVLYLVT